MAKYIHLKGLELQQITNFKHVERWKVRRLIAGHKVELGEREVGELRALGIHIRKQTKRR